MQIGISYCLHCVAISVPPPMTKQGIDHRIVSGRRNVVPNSNTNVASIVISLWAISFLLFVCDRPNDLVVVARMISIPVKAISAKPNVGYMYELSKERLMDALTLSAKSLGQF